MNDGHWTAPGKRLSASVPDYDAAMGGNQSSYLRLGVPAASHEQLLLDSLETSFKEKLTPLPGWLEYTDGDRGIATRKSAREVVGEDYALYVEKNSTVEVKLDATTTIGGNETITVGGDETTTITGDATIGIGGKKVETIASHYRLNIGAGTLETYNADPVYKIEFFEQDVLAAGKASWRKRELAHNSSDSYSFGDVESFFGGYKFDAMFGLTNEIFVGGKVNLAIAASLEATMGYAIELGMGLKYSSVKGKDLNVASDHEIKARKTVHLRIKPEHESTDSMRNKVAAGLAAAGGTVVAAALAAGTAGGEVDSEGVAVAPAACLGAASAVFAAGLAASVFLALREKASPKRSTAELQMDKDGVKIAHNSPTGAVNAQASIDHTGLVSLRNRQGSKLELDAEGDVVARAARSVLIQLQPNTTVIQVTRAKFTARTPYFHVNTPRARIAGALTIR